MYWCYNIYLIHERVAQYLVQSSKYVPDVPSVEMWNHPQCVLVCALVSQLTGSDALWLVWHPVH